MAKPFLRKNDNSVKNCFLLEEWTQIIKLASRANEENRETKKIISD